MLDRDVAIWLAELLLEATSNLDDQPGLTVEVEGTPNHWVQALPEGSEGELLGYTLNFPYRNLQGDPLVAFENAGLHPPPYTEALEWEDDGFASVRIRADIPIIALAHFIGDILEGIVGASPGAELAAYVEYGF